MRPKKVSKLPNCAGWLCEENGIATQVSLVQNYTFSTIPDGPFRTHGLTGREYANVKKVAACKNLSNCHFFEMKP